MEWISTKIRFPEAGEQVLTACKNKNKEDGIWLYDLCYYYPDYGWENRENWEDVLYWTYIDEPKENCVVAHYIDKDALVAEIEKRLNHQVYLSVEREIREQLLTGLLIFINTLEVKEVDLDWQDIYSILYLERIVQHEFGDHEYSNEGLCQEVLRRFKAQKGKEV